MNILSHKSMRHLRYYILMSVLFALVIVRNVIGVKIPVASFLGVAVMVGLLCNNEEIVAFICSMAPFEMTFQYRYMIIICAVFMIMKNKRFILKSILPIVFMLVWDYMHYINEGVAISSFMRACGVLLGVGTVLMIKPINYSDGLPIRSFSICTLFSCVVTLVVNRGLTGYSFASSDRLGSTYDMAESYNALLNPNVGSFLCVLSICGLVLLLKYGSNKYTEISIIAALSVFVLLFQSKSAMISLAFAIIIYLYANNKNWIMPTLRIIGLLILIGILGFIFFRRAIEGVLSRFVAGDFSTGRVGIFGFYHSYLFSDPKHYLFGIGLFDYAGRIAAQLSRSVLESSHAVTYVNDKLVLIVSHNNLQEILLVWGVPGVILVGWLLRSMIRHKRNNRTIMHYLAFYFILLYTLQGQLLSSNVVLIGLIFSLVCMEYQKDTPSEMIKAILNRK